MHEQLAQKKVQVQESFNTLEQQRQAKLAQVQQLQQEIQQLMNELVKLQGAWATLEQLAIEINGKEEQKDG